MPLCVFKFFSTNIFNDLLAFFICLKKVMCVFHCQFIFLMYFISLLSPSISSTFCRSFHHHSLDFPYYYLLQLLSLMKNLFCIVIVFTYFNQSIPICVLISAYSSLFLTIESILITLQVVSL